MNQKTTIIVTAHNYACYLEQCVDSLLAQSVLPVEIIVINDASSDNTEDVMKKYTDNDLVQYFVADFESVQKARNFGLEKSKGEYILNMDADNYLDDKFLEKTQKVLDANTDIDLVYTDHLVFGDEKLIAATAQGKYWMSKNFEYNSLQQMNYIDTTSLIRKKDFKGFDENVRRFQDWDAWLTFLKDKQAQRVSEHLLFKRLHGTSKTSTVQLYMERMRVMTKHDLMTICDNSDGGDILRKVKGNIACIIVAKNDNEKILEQIVNIKRIKKIFVYIMDIGDRGSLMNMKKVLQEKDVVYRVIHQNSIDIVLKGLRMSEYMPAYSMNYLVVINDAKDDVICKLQRRCDACYSADNELTQCDSFDEIDYIIFNKKGIRKLLNP
ncbi:MAG: glycosyltransferase family 2 protein [Candidatus Moraniibacteriota bacterium]|jgi:glycosyltransferase involved in cell wall biosynthesis